MKHCNCGAAPRQHACASLLASWELNAAAIQLTARPPIWVLTRTFTKPCEYLDGKKE